MVGLMMQTTHQTDQDIQANVTEELLYDPCCQTGQLTVKRSAMRVRGVKAVTDEMTVRSPGASGDATDADITQAARHMLDWSVDVPANAVKVAVRDHKATLSGTVAWGYQRDA